MVIEFYLTSSKYLFHNQVVELPEDTVELLFIPTAFSVGTLTLSLETPRQSKQYKVSPNVPIDVSEMFDEAGEVTAAVSLSVRGEVARTWQIEPFCVKKIPTGIEVIPAIEEMKQRLSTVENAIKEILDLINND